MKRVYNPRRRCSIAILIATMLLPSISAVITAENESQSASESVTLEIHGGFGYWMCATNHGTEQVIVHYTAEAYGIFRPDCIRDIQGYFGVPPGWTIEEQTIPLITMHPLAWITVKMWTETRSIERSGLELFSNFFIFF